MLFNIQKCSVHDGCGLRTLVFFKGCPLRCLWCANPESQSFKPQIMESPAKCIGCGACIRTCPEGAITMSPEGYTIDRGKCTSCFRCADRCYAEAKYVMGKEYTIDELLKEIKKDKLFYDQKGGGVTFSGGEPLCQPEYLTEITRACHRSGIHVMLESCAMGEFSAFKSALPYIDAMFVDIKHIDTKIHKQLTGSGNEIILKNIAAISDFGIPLTVRTPIIPGLNDSIENIRGIARFIKTLKTVKEYELLPYHKLGVNKYRALGRAYQLDEIQPPAGSEMENLVREANAVLNDTGIECFYTKDNARVVIK